MPSAGMLARFNAFLPGRIELLAVNGTTPRLQHAGALEPPATLSARVSAERERLSAPGRYNERQAILAGEPGSDATGLILPYYDAEYAVIAALRAAGNPPLVLSASVLLVSDETREIFVQRRSAFCDAAAGLLHTVSGAQRVPIEGSLDRALHLTAAREVREETGLDVPLPATLPTVVVRERLATSIQYVVLGPVISGEQARAIRPSLEGPIVPIHFDALERSLVDERQHWAPTGYIHVLAWLAWDDNSGRDFGGLSANDLLDRALRISTGQRWTGIPGLEA